MKRKKSNDLFRLIPYITFIMGVGMIIGGLWGAIFTYSNVVRENINTPDDATIPNALVSGPLTLKSQADVIRHHTLETTENRTYAEMSRDEDRSIWIIATTLMTALNLAILAYAISALSISLGIFLILSGLVFRKVLS